MGKAEIAVIDITKEAICKENGKWGEMCKKVREGSEKHGFFLLRNENIPSSLFQNLLISIRSLFDLPEETKLKYINPKPYRS